MRCSVAQFRAVWARGLASHMVNLSYTPHGTANPMSVGLNRLFEGFFLQLAGLLFVRDVFGVLASWLIRHPSCRFAGRVCGRSDPGRLRQHLLAPGSVVPVRRRRFSRSPSCFPPESRYVFRVGDRCIPPMRSPGSFASFAAIGTGGALWTCVRRIRVPRELAAPHLGIPYAMS